MRRAILGALVVLACTAPASAGPELWFGGGVGLWFGDVNFVEVQPIVGMNFSKRLSGAVSVLYRWRDDGRYSPSLSTSDYGASLIGRFQVANPLFLQAEYEYLEYEVVFTDRSTDRRSYDSVLVGAGFSRSTGGRAAIYGAVLYNLSYSDSDPGPYNDPWVVRAGVTFGF